MEPFETIEHAGCTIEFHYDEAPMSPAEWDTLGTMYAVDREAEYRGFESMSATHGQALEALERRGVAGMLRYLRLAYGLHVLPVDVFDHGSSGIILRVASERDDSCSAYFATDDKRVTELCGADPKYHTREWIEKALRGELAEWSSYFEGDVCGYVVRSASGEVVESLWGIYPDSEPTPPNEHSSDSYRVAWELLDSWARRYANAIAEAVDAAEYERDEKERAANMEVPTV